MVYLDIVAAALLQCCPVAALLAALSVDSLLRKRRCKMTDACLTASGLLSHSDHMRRETRSKRGFREVSDLRLSSAVIR